MKYQLLLNSQLKKYILKLPMHEKKRVREKFEYLETGIWDSGLKVKKLKGPGKKVVFEGRLDKANRILFTLGTIDDKVGIYIWGITKHDDISKNAELITPSNAPFLNFEPESTIDSDEFYLDEVADDFLSQEKLEDHTKDDYGPQKWCILNDVQWNRFIANSDGEAENFEMYLQLTKVQEEILTKDPPILLSGTAGSGKTTLSVYYLLREDLLTKRKLFVTYNKYLKNICKKMYDGLITYTDEETDIVKPDFFVFKDLLYTVAGESNGFEPKDEITFSNFHLIYDNHPLSKKYDAELVWQEIRSIIKGAKPPISISFLKKMITKIIQDSISQREIHLLKEFLVELTNFTWFTKANKVITKKTGYNLPEQFFTNLSLEITNYQERTLEILSELLRIVGSIADDFTSPLLDFDEYQSIGKKRAPYFYYDRKDIYEIALYYQDKLDENKWWDELDLCKFAINRLKNSYTHFQAYDFVICDEIQDFTDIQLYFILNLTLRMNTILFAGDPKQLINPSQFRWEEVKEKFYNRHPVVPDVNHLVLNFRSVGNIVRLGNALLDIKQKLIGLSGSEQKEKWKFNGRPPVVIYDFEEEAFLNRYFSSGANQVILVRDDLEKARLKRRIKTDLIFTIHEAKGLEFNTVLIWKFINNEKYRELWNKIKMGSDPDQTAFPHIKYELNLLYVAITRARNNLIFYDGKYHSELWDIESLDTHVYKCDDDAYLQDIWTNLSTRKEWDEQGDYFFEREYFAAALECFKNSGNTDKYIHAKAFHHEFLEEYEEAAPLFNSIGEYKHAMTCYARIKNYEEALMMAKKISDDDAIKLYSLYIMEDKKEFKKAAAGWVELGNIERALDNWTKGYCYREMADYYFDEHDFLKAAELFIKAKDREKGAYAYIKAEAWQQAADIYYQTKDYKKALTYYQKSNDTKQQLACYHKLKDYLMLIRYYEREKDNENALIYLKQFINQSPENLELIREETEKSIESGKSRRKAALRCIALEEFEMAGDIYYSLGDFQDALNAFLLADDSSDNSEKIAECYLKLKDYYNHITTLEEVDPKYYFKKIVMSHQEAIKQNHDVNDTKMIQAISREARQMLQNKQYFEALARYKSIHNNEYCIKSLCHIKDVQWVLKEFDTSDDREILTGYFESLTNTRLSINDIKAIISRATHYIDSPEEDNALRKSIITLCHYNIDDRIETYEIEQIQKDLFVYFNHSELFSSDGLLRYNEIQVWHTKYLSLLISSRCYNYIHALARHLANRKEYSSNEQSLSTVLRNEFSSYSDRPELLCSHTFVNHDHKAYIGSLKTCLVNESNHLIFAYHVIEYEKAVDYYLNLELYDNAVSTCRNNRNYIRAAEISETINRLNDAGDDYVNAEQYKKALKCYKRSGNLKKVAHVHEKMGDYKKALGLYRELGAAQSVRRIMKKLNIDGYDEKLRL